MDVFSELSRLGALIRQLQGILKFLTGKQIAFGAGTIAWPGGAAISNAATVNHGLGRVPVVALGIVGQLSDGTGQSAFTALELATFTSTQVAFRATAYNHNPAAAVNATLHWVVIG